MTTTKIKSFTQLIAWQKSHKLVLETLTAFETLPRNDVIRNQIERAALSVTSNIAEGFGRQSPKDKKHFYVIARGSAFELQSQLLISRDTNRIDKNSFETLASLSTNSIKLLHGLIRSIKVT
jgi:four helix bundle protein